MARGLLALLPPIEVVDGSFCNSDPDDPRSWEVRSAWVILDLARNRMSHPKLGEVKIWYVPPHLQINIFRTCPQAGLAAKISGLPEVPRKLREAPFVQVRR